jgi:hypothetical protein
MYCPSCGKEILESSTFCSHCGKPTLAPVSTVTVQQNVKEWEYKNYSLTYNEGETGWVDAQQYPEPSARLYYWQNIQHEIMPELQQLFDEGWQPTTEVGPACIELRYYKSGEGVNKTGYWVGALFTYGVSLLGLIWAKTWKFQMVGFHLQLRRPKIMSQEVV